MGIVFTLALALTIENRTLTADAKTGRAVIDIRGETNVVIRNVVIDGGRKRFDHPFKVAENGAPFIDYYPLNAIAIDRSANVRIENVTIRNAVNLAIVIARSKGVVIRNVTVEDSGTLDEAGKNNTTGGILIEEGTVDFEISGCRLRRIRGNAIWTHSYTESPRNANGAIVRNEIDTVGRDAIQVGHSTGVRVANNTIRHVGYPTEIVDADPVGVDTAGDVDATHYLENRIYEVNGKCFDLDGFRDGSIVSNVCINAGPIGRYPRGHFAVVFNDSHPQSRSQNIRLEGNTFQGMKYGGFYVIGGGHTIENNALLNLNRAGSVDPLLGSSIAFADGILRPNPASATVRRNRITGAARCPDPHPNVKLEQNRCETTWKP